ncbi:hypothetical protein P691DRAFT_780247 [Macrolepiota fuliginosa MF-IS2]|uniref:Uncharacterized protein n=1 Tax=Macrolepiota fuliginosa MF-IS2 TaxID=1400762 RepID=A0A9P5WX40_9AGAR|nr:hypothetical protein P691DRAFT_780247 [Macrolepiota fuliginosa MF-IS2]
MFEDFDHEATELDIECLTRIFGELTDNFSAGITLYWDYLPPQGDPYDIQTNIEDQHDRVYAAAMDSFWTLFDRGKAVPIRYLKLFDMDSFANFMEDLDNNIFSEKNRRKFLEHNVLLEIPLGILDTNRILQRTSSRVLFKYMRLEVEDSPLDSASMDESGIVGYVPHHSLLVDDSRVEWNDDNIGNDRRFGYATLEFTRDILKQGQIRSPDHPVVAYIDGLNIGWILYEYTDPRDDRAEWRLTIPYAFPSETGIESL